MIAEHGGCDAPKPPEIDGQDGQNGTELDQHHEGLAESIVIEAEEPLDQQQMPGRGHRQKLGQTLDDTEDEGLENVESHSSSEEAGKGGAEGTALVPHHSPGSNGERARLHRLLRTTSIRTVGRGPTITAGAVVAARGSPQALRRMLTLFHHPFCPHSRFVRLALGEHGIAVRAVEERVWERREEFLVLNPAATTPVLVEEGCPAVPGAAIIAEYLDETRGAELGGLRLLPLESRARVEVRRLMSWFNDKFFAEVSGPLTMERLYKRHMPVSVGGGSPETEVLRAARHNVRYHLAYIGWLVRTRDWLAGQRMSYADLAAAAHLSAIDYLGDVPWNEDEAAKTWYARVKSRPSFRPMLTETLAGIPPSQTYADLDF